MAVESRRDLSCPPRRRGLRLSLAPGQSSYGRLLVIVDIPAPGENLTLLTAGAYLDEDHVTGDELHNQMFTLPAEPTPIGFEESGSPEVLAARTGHWFGTLLRRPVVRHEWLRSGEVYAHRWLFADSGQPLCEGQIRTGDLAAPERASLTARCQAGWCAMMWRVTATSGQGFRMAMDDRCSGRRGTYRVIYRIDDKARVVTVIDVAHRRDVYRT